MAKKVNNPDKPGVVIPIMSKTKNTYSPVKIAHLTNYMVGPVGGPVPELRSVDLPDDRSPPKGVLVGFYGQTKTLGRIRKMHIEALKNRQVLYLVDIQVKVDTNFTKRPRPDELAEVKYLNLFRATNETSDHILDLIKASPADRRKGANGAIADNPDLLLKIWDTPELAHISLILWKAQDNQYYGAVHYVRDIEQAVLLGNKDSHGEWQPNLEALLT